MADMSRPVPGPQPGPDPTASPGPSGSVPAARIVAARAAHNADEPTLIELRRKVQSGELLSAATERLLWKMRFNGHLTVVVQNGRVLKSGYEEGYFRRRNDRDALLLDV